MRLNPDLSHSRRKARPIFEELRRAVLAGRFKEGEKLLGSRTLAAQLGVARGTVNIALAQLAAEHLVEIVPGAGARVVACIAPRHKSVVPQKIKLSRWALRLTKGSPSDPPAFFASGRLADEYFPEREWLRALKVSQREFGLMRSDFETSPAGFLPLAESIAAT